MALPSIESLRCFEAAAQLPSFRAAARAVGITPAALGQRIQLLEQELGTSLFHRTTRSVVLTEAGLRLLPRARAVLSAAAECGRAARGEVGLPPMELTLGTRHELGLSFVAPHSRDLMASQPGLHLNLYFSSGPDLLLRIRSRELDCAMTSARLTDPLLDSIRMHREDYVLVAAPRLLQSQPLRRAEDATRHVLLDIGSELPLFRYWRDAPGGGDRLRFARLWSLGAVSAIRQAAIAGCGVAVLPAYFVAEDLAKKRLRVVLPSVTPLFDYFRLVFRLDDSRRPFFDRLARELQAWPLK
jgi:LysR family glycine cleavage system transcriptional activator